MNDSSRNTSRLDIAWVFGVAAWCGIVSGIVEAIGLLAFQKMRWVRANALMWISPEILWISPLANLILFCGLAVLVAFTAPLGTRMRTRALPAIVFSFLTVYDWLGVASYGHIRRYAVVALSAGLAVSMGRWIQQHEERAFFLVRCTLPWLLASLLILALGTQAGLELKKLAAEKALTEAEPNSPNVLLVIIDTLRADHLSSYRYERLTSPQLDSLAREGTVFENAFATSSWSLPSHASLLTGRYPYEHAAEELLQALDGRYATLAEYLGSHGYRTAAFSANPIYFARGVGLDRGFTHFEDHFYSIADWWIRTGFGREFFALQEVLGIPQNYPQRKRASDVRASMMNWIERNDDRPFFVAANFFDTHFPYPPPAPFDKKFSGNSSQDIDAYDGAIAYVDDQIKLLMDELRSRGRDRNTIVVVTSDHGESFGEHGLTQHRFALYRELIHVPLIFWWPDHIAGNRRVERPISLAALPATLSDLTGLGKGSPFPGSSLAALWTSRENGQSRFYPLAELAQMPPVEGMDTPAFHGSLKSLVDGRWHYIISNKMGVELYDWDRDPVELHNMAETPEGQVVAQQFSGYLKGLIGGTFVAGDHR